MLNSFINKLPIELHIPGYNFCGPGTKLQSRLKRGDKGVNQLDDACKEHDIAYGLYKDLGGRHKADIKLANTAWERVKSKNSTVNEKISAWLVTNAMVAKTKLGMGSKLNKTKTQKVIKGQREKSSKITNDKKQRNDKIVIMRQLIQAKQNVKHKLNEIRKRRLDNDRMFNPIKQIKQEIKSEIKNDLNENDKLFKIEKIHEHQIAPSVNNDIKPIYEEVEPEDDVFQSLPEEIVEEVTSQRRQSILDSTRELEDLVYGTEAGEDLLNNLSELPKKYFSLLISANLNIDNTYGPYVENGELRLGIKSMSFDGDDIVLDQKESYKGTDGLFKLIFFKRPSGYTAEDKKNYRNILTSTRAYYTNYGRGLKRNVSGQKYKDLIKYLVGANVLRSKSASGLSEGLLKQVNPHKTRIEYVPWFSINKIINRLRILYSSQLAGNNNVQNEIVSIIEKLKENNIIE